MRTKQISRRPKSPTDGRWAFNLSSERLFVLGIAGKRNYAAFRTSDDQLRFLPS